MLHHTHSREAEGRGFEIGRTLSRPQKDMAPTRFPAPESDLPHDGTYQLNVLSARRPRGNQDSCADLSAIISRAPSKLEGHARSLTIFSTYEGHSMKHVANRTVMFLMAERWWDIAGKVNQ